jgi:sterol desaturase/sphingolipid hydroxylase (fatty acid hydroxylase superfamily)
MKTSPVARALLGGLWWPLLLSLCVSCQAFGMARGWGPSTYAATYAGLALTLFFLERWMPHERRWLEHDGQLWPDLGHTVLSTVAAQGGALGLAMVGLNWAVGRRPGSGLWPTGWPIAGQIMLGMVVAEFGLYWAHRIAHERDWLWRFHSVHHSSTRLWFFNNSRFHFVDSLKSVLLSIPLLLLVGAPGDIIIWVSASTSFIGILTHCNVEMRFGPLNYVFNTPGLHRWHHSTDLREGNQNYGESLVLFDLIFGTYFNPNRRPPVTIGIKETLPKTFLAQVVAPFVWRKYRLAPGPTGRDAVGSSQR